MVDGKAIPGHPWDPNGPALSADIPLLIGYARTEETLYDRPTPEKLALDEAGLQSARAKRLGGDPERVIEAFRKAHPDATPWDLWILIATDHPRGTYSRELAKRKAAQRGAPAFAYRFDWETPEGGGHMRSPHTIEIPFVFNNIKIAGPLISKMPEAYALAEKVSAAWVAFARTGDPNTPKLPKWPAYSAASRDTMLFNNDSRVEQDPDRGPRLVMEQGAEAVVRNESELTGLNRVERKSNMKPRAVQIATGVAALTDDRPLAFMTESRDGINTCCAMGWNAARLSEW